MRRPKISTKGSSAPGRRIFLSKRWKVKEEEQLHNDDFHNVNKWVISYSKIRV
jgi:hypothetical protein